MLRLSVAVALTGCHHSASAAVRPPPAAPPSPTAASNTAALASALTECPTGRPATDHEAPADRALIQQLQAARTLELTAALQWQCQFVYEEAPLPKDEKLLITLTPREGAVCKTDDCLELELYAPCWTTPVHVSLESDRGSIKQQFDGILRIRPDGTLWVRRSEFLPKHETAYFPGLQALYPAAGNELYLYELFEVRIASGKPAVGIHFDGLLKGSDCMQSTWNCQATPELLPPLEP